MSETQQPYRTLFIGTLVQESFLSLGGTDDPFTTVDSPFCRDGNGRPTLRGSGLAGALIATLRRLRGDIPEKISGNAQGQHASVWRFFNSHPNITAFADRQHVAIDHKTGAATEGALFNVETLPPATCWPFLLEVDTTGENGSNFADLAEKALAHWVAGRCLLGREVARGMGWLRLDDLKEYTLTTAHIDDWPNAKKSEKYPDYLVQLAKDRQLDVKQISAATIPLPGWREYTLALSAGERNDGYGIDSLSIGGHASEELATSWDESFLAPDGISEQAAKSGFDPDFAVVTLEQNGKRMPYIPGSSLRGPLRHALARLPKDGKKPEPLVNHLFGTTEASAKLLIRDAFLIEDTEKPMQLAWFQHHAEDEFAGGAYASSKFDRIAVMQGCFSTRLVIEDASDDEIAAFETIKKLAEQGQIGIGGGQWRGHGWLPWVISELSETCQQKETTHE
jgi:CRISPR/Cas system CSM-associated protein Csm3 (group 7 of RAMP superfamily)